MKQVQELHERALRCAKSYRQAESSLLEILIQIEEKKAYVALGFSSLFHYCTASLKLSESQSYALISVARKIKEVPELKSLIDTGELHLSNARRIVSIIGPENKKEWLEKATTLTQRELEREIATIHPELLPKEKLRPVTEHYSELKVAIPKGLEEKLRQVCDLLSQKKKRNVPVSEAIAEMVEGFLERYDPVRKAARNVKSKGATSPCDGKRKLPAQVKHRVSLRDRNRCTFRDKRGRRCERMRWLQIHHLIPISRGGLNTPENLRTLCHNHHRLVHQSTPTTTNDTQPGHSQ